MSLLGILAAAAVFCGLAVLSSLVYWWWRPEEVFLVLLGVLAVRFLVVGVPLLSLRPRRVLVAGIVLYAAFSPSSPSAGT